MASLLESRVYGPVVSLIKWLGEHMLLLQADSVIFIWSIFSSPWSPLCWWASSIISISLQLVLLALCLLFLPYLTVGVIRKMKAGLQGRIGAPIVQPLLDVLKMLKKGQTPKRNNTGFFNLAPLFASARWCLLHVLCPGCLSDVHGGGDDLFILLYMLATLRFFTLLGAYGYRQCFFWIWRQPGSLPVIVD